MPKIVVQIEWDVPDEPHWLNPSNIELVFAEYYPNTAFTVTELGDVVEALRGLVQLRHGNNWIQAWVEDALDRAEKALAKLEEIK